MRLALTSVAFALALGAPSLAGTPPAPSADGARAARADMDYEGQVRRYLTEQAGKIAGEGFHADRAIPDMVRPLRLQGAALWPLSLRAGVTYRVLAVCDNDCSDVDLELYDAVGALAGRDVETNDAPYVEFTPAADGPAYARIWLAACEHEPCYVGARVYRK